jgi:dihydrofolate reductase
MRKVIVAEFLSLDGVMGAPDEWHFPYWSDEMGDAIGTQFFASDALLLGRVTYQGFAAAWPSRTTDDDEFADRINSMPKFVVSTTLETPLEWNNSRLIKGNVAKEITKLKQQPGADILINGSATLVQSLLQDDLLDEIRLLVHPVVVGSGKCLFEDGGDLKALRLVDSKTFSTDVVSLTYQPDRNEPK